MNVYIKSLIFLIIFSILHFGYDLTSWPFLRPFCGIDESVFQHLKIAFWAYFFVSLIEYFGFKKKWAFWYSRLLSTTILPWFIFLIWYLAPAFFGKLSSSKLELLWAIFSSYASAVMAGIFEKNVESRSVNLSFKIVVLVLFIISAILYIRFTFQLPWIDLFVNPEIL